MKLLYEYCYNCGEKTLTIYADGGKFCAECAKERKEDEDEKSEGA